MISITITGKITSSLRVEQVKNEENRTVDMHRLVLLGQVQGHPGEECQVEFRSYDPHITSVMKHAKVGDSFCVTGALASTFKTYKDEKTNELKRKPAYYYIHANQVEKIYEV